MEPIHIVLVDDHAVVRAGLRLIIESYPGMVVVGEAATGAEALAVLGGTRADVVLLDLDLGDEDGIDLIREFIATVPGVQVLVLTGLRDQEAHRRVVLQGAMGLVLKSRASETVIRAIQKVHAGEVWFDRALIADVLRERVRPIEAEPERPEVTSIQALTAREREVIALVGEGLKNRDIASRLVISEATVRHHLTSIFSKLGVPDRAGLLLYAFRHKLITPQE